MDNFEEIYHISRIQRGSNIVQGAGGGVVQLFPGGSNCLFPIESHITCDFPVGGGVQTPCPPSGSALAVIIYEKIIDELNDLFICACIACCVCLLMQEQTVCPM